MDVKQQDEDNEQSQTAAAAGPHQSVPDSAGNASSRAVYVACCHLYPGPSEASRRAAQLAGILSSILSHNPAADACIVIAGDMNMRESETGVALQLGLPIGLKDAWLLSGSHPSVKFTWNSKVNQYLADWFGFTCRFDRVFVSSGVQVHGFSLVGDQPVEGQPGHYLSDHFGTAAAACVSQALMFQGQFW
jgi:endonuclease/exonuclease/phosphatase family metal-dependent hydrolase